MYRNGGRVLPPVKNRHEPKKGIHGQKLFGKKAFLKFRPENQAN